MIAPIFALATAAFAATPVNNDKPYIMQKASDAMVNYAVNYRKTDVPVSQASSAAAEIVDKVLAQPQATELAKSAVSYLAANGPTVDGAAARQAATKASSFYDEIATKPAYTQFANELAQKTSLFDVNRAFNDAQEKLAAVGNQHNDKARNAVVRANAAYRQLALDPNGAEAIKTGRELAGRVAKDFQVDTSKVNSKFARAKSNLLTRLFS